MSSKFTSNGSLQDMIHDMQKMQKPPLKTIFELEQALLKGFASTQAGVHVITSSLKWSGKTASDFNGEEWSGEVSYGGPSTGVHNPVEYAIYEAQRGGAHDFMTPLDATTEEMDKIVDKMYDLGGDL